MSSIVPTTDQDDQFVPQSRTVSPLTLPLAAVFVLLAIFISACLAACVSIMSVRSLGTVDSMQAKIMQSVLDGRIQAIDRELTQFERLSNQLCHLVNVTNASRAISTRDIPRLLDIHSQMAELVLAEKIASTLSAAIIERPGVGYEMAASRLSPDGTGASLLTIYWNETAKYYWRNSRRLSMSDLFNHNYPPPGANSRSSIISPSYDDDWIAVKEFNKGRSYVYGDVGLTTARSLDTDLSKIWVNSSNTKQLLGVCSVIISLGFAADTVRPIPDVPTARAILADFITGNLIYTSQGDEAFEYTKGFFNGTTINQSDWAPIQAINHKKDWIRLSYKSVLEGAQGKVIKTSEGKFSIHYEQIKSHNLQWGIILVIPFDFYSKDTTASIQQSIIIVCVTFVVFILVFVGIVLSIQLPLSGLLQSMHRTAVLDFSVAIRLKTFRVKELHQIQEQYLVMSNHLANMRKYVPQNVLHLFAGEIPRLPELTANSEHGSSIAIGSSDRHKSISGPAQVRAEKGDHSSSCGSSRSDRYLDVFSSKSCVGVLTITATLKKGQPLEKYLRQIPKLTDLLMQSCVQRKGFLEIVDEWTCILTFNAFSIVDNPVNAAVMALGNILESVEEHLADRVFNIGMGMAAGPCAVCEIGCRARMKLAAVGACIPKSLELSKLSVQCGIPLCDGLCSQTDQAVFLPIQKITVISLEKKTTETIHTFVCKIDSHDGEWLYHARVDAITRAVTEYTTILKMSESNKDQFIEKLLAFTHGDCGEVFEKRFGQIKSMFAEGYKLPHTIRLWSHDRLE